MDHKKPRRLRHSWRNDTKQPWGEAWLCRSGARLFAARRKPALKHFRELCRPGFCWYPTHSAEKRGMDGARKSTVNPKMLPNAVGRDPQLNEVYSRSTSQTIKSALKRNFQVRISWIGARVDFLMACGKVCAGVETYRTVCRSGLAAVGVRGYPLLPGIYRFHGSFTCASLLPWG
jgi:hypothetical protein